MAGEPWIDPDVLDDAELLADLWPDAPLGATLTTVLESAQEECEAFASSVPFEIPARFRIALIMQARSMARSFLAGSGDQIGPDGLTITVWPMDRTVKALLRPQRHRSVR